VSQIIKSLLSGPVPPDVPTSFITDDGTAIPLVNILNVDGLDSIENNNDGIVTRANPDLGNNLEIILTNRISVTAITSDGAGQTQTVTLMTPTNATAIEFNSSFIGYDSANDEAAGGAQEGIARKSAGAVTVIGTNDSFDESDAGLLTVDWDIIASGGDLIARFIGVAGRTIVWRCTFTYIQTP